MGAGILNLENPANWAGVTHSPALPIDIASIQANLISYLQSLQVAGNPLQQIEIAPFPDRPRGYRMTHRVGAVLLMYRGSSYGDEKLNARYVVQERKLEFEATVLMRDLGWAYGGAPSGTSPGAYAIVEALRAALTGYRVPGCGKAYISRDGYQDHDDDGVWIYSLRFVVPSMSVENAQAPNLANLTQGKFNVSVNGAPSADQTEAVASGGSSPTNPSN